LLADWERADALAGRSEGDSPSRLGSSLLPTWCGLWLVGMLWDTSGRASGPTYHLICNKDDEEIERARRLVALRLFELWMRIDW